jgi:hypothetical protein
MKYEHRGKPPLSSVAFLGRMAKHFGVAILLLAVPIAFGMVGFVCCEGLCWRTAFLHVATILGGHGSAHIDSPKCEIFVGMFGLFADLVSIGVVGVVLAPIGHRVLHFLYHEKQS